MKRVVQYSLLVVLVIIFYFRGIKPAWNEMHSDFSNYYVSAKLVLEKDSLDRLYDNEWFQQKIAAQGIITPGKFAPFPPATAWMMMPIANFSPLTAQRIFLFLNLISLFLCIRLLKKITSGDLLYCSLLTLGGGLSIINNIKFGQVYLVMTVFILLAILLARHRYPVIAGVILGLFTSVKYFPIVFIVACFFNGLHDRNEPFGKTSNYFTPDLKIVLSAVATIMLILGAEFLFFGNNVMNQFISSVLLPHLDGELSGQGLYSFQFQSWDNLFRNIFVKDNLFNPSPVIDWAPGKTVLKLTVSVIICGWSVLVLYRVRTNTADKRISIYSTVLSLTALVLLPASATYHFVLLLVPLGLIIGQQLIDQKLTRIAILLYVIMGFIPYGAAFAAGKSWGLLFAYPRLWLITAIFLVILHGLSKKKELNSTW